MKEGIIALYAKVAPLCKIGAIERSTSIGKISHSVYHTWVMIASVPLCGCNHYKGTTLLIAACFRSLNQVRRYATTAFDSVKIFSIDFYNTLTTRVIL
jgi:hypothetical protein